jgi:hypothetical protein
MITVHFVTADRESKTRTKPLRSELRSEGSVTTHQ